MKIREIYGSKNKCIVSIIMAALCIAITLITALIPDTYTKVTYAYPLIYPWQILSGIFVHGSPDLGVTGTVGHLGFNLLLVLPFGILIEKITGSKKFLIYTVCLWVINAITFYIIAFFSTPAGEHSYGAGISGIAFSYGAVGLYALFKLFKKDKKQAIRQVSFWLLLNIALIMLVMINPFIAGSASMIMHLVSVIAGIIYLLIRHKDIDRCFEQ